jgi:signal transduction histidine kinase
MHALDPQAFHTIVSNLLHNAVRYVDAGGQVLVELGQRNGVLTLTVSDDGPGIPAAEHDLVFERFYRCQRHSVPGSGLGLAIVRQAAARMRGTVRLEPAAHGKGCRFIAELPGGAGTETRRN